MATTTGFAAGLTLVSSFPEEGNAALTPQNVAIKLVFSEKISDPTSIAANANSFRLVDGEGKAVEFEPLYNESKYPNEVWLQISENLTQDTAYKVVIAEGMQSSTGNSLEEDITLNFATRNTEADNTGYMVLMGIMVVGMMVFTVFDTKRKLKKESAEEEDQRVNPYKEAKRTGKSVEDIVARTEKEKAQAERRKAKVTRRQGTTPANEKKEPVRPGVKRVKAPRTISEKGYATPQSFIDDRMAREARVEAKAKAKQQQSRSKGSKQQQRKKK